MERFDHDVFVSAMLDVEIELVELGALDAGLSLDDGLVTGEVLELIELAMGA